MVTTDNRFHCIVDLTEKSRTKHACSVGKEERLEVEYSRVWGSGAYVLQQSKSIEA